MRLSRKLQEEKMGRMDRAITINSKPLSLRRYFIWETTLHHQFSIHQNQLIFKWWRRITNSITLMGPLAIMHLQERVPSKTPMLVEIPKQIVWMVRWRLLQEVYFNFHSRDVPAVCLSQSKRLKFRSRWKTQTITTEEDMLVLAPKPQSLQQQEEL